MEVTVAVEEAVDLEEEVVEEEVASVEEEAADMAAVMVEAELEEATEVARKSCPTTKFTSPACPPTSTKKTLLNFSDPLE